MNLLSLLLLGAALCAPLSGLAEETAARPASLTASLEQLGYPNGLIFDGSTQPSEQTLLFHLPKEMTVKSATLRIVYRGSSQLGRGALLRAVINEQSPQVREVEADRGFREWRIEVPESELEGGQLKVKLSGNIPLDYGTIVDGEPRSGVIHIAPDSNLVSTLEGEPVTLRDSWLTLPDEVVVTIPHGILSETTFKAALDWVTMLQRNHHRVRIATLPAIGNVVIAPQSDIIAAMAYSSMGQAGVRSLWGKSGSSMGLVHFNGNTFIAVTPPYTDAEGFAANWQALSQPFYVTPENHGADVQLDNVPLIERGLSVAPALLEHKIQWKATLTPWNLPPGTHPRSAKIYLALPKADAQVTFRLFVYLNDRMLTSYRFAGDGTTREITIPFDAVPQDDSYQLRLVVRDSGESDNVRAEKKYSFQLTSQSHVTLAREHQVIEGFSSIVTSLGQGFDLYVPREYLSTAVHELPRIAQLLAGFVVPSTNYTVVMMESGHAPRPHRSFVIVGDVPPGDAALPLRFDEGKVQLINNRNEILVGEQRIRSAGVIQLVDSDEASGLWFHPGEVEQLPAIDSNRLGSDDIALYEPDRLLLSINSHQEDLARPQYLENPSWHERLYNQRVMWLLLGWVLLSMGITYLYIKSRQHRNV